MSPIQSYTNSDGLVSGNSHVLHWYWYPMLGCDNLHYGNRLGHLLS